MWTESIKNFEINQNALYNDIMVPTNDSTRNLFLMKNMLLNDYNVMCTGPTGVGKS